jgi:hypothetical protein
MCSTGAEEVGVSGADEARQQPTYNPWTVVNVVFRHLTDQGMEPTLGVGGDPGEPAAELLRALGVVPAAEGDARVKEDVHQRLATLRATMLDEP